MRLFSRLSGDDIFISYSRKDGALYAAGLADALTSKHFSCFIDKLGVKPDHDLPPDLIRKIKSCSIFVIAGTERAAKSTFVQKEIRVFKETGRTILPIDFDENIAAAIWYDDVPGLAVEPEKAPDALDKGDPSDNVVRFIEKSFNYTRRNRYMARMVSGAIALFIVLTSLGIGSFLFFGGKATAAIAEANEARIEAVNAKSEANTAKQQTEVAKIAANTATNIADQEKGRADAEAYRATTQTAIADAKTKEAREATDLAAEKTKFAIEQQRIALENIKEAERQQGIAKEKTTEAGNLLYDANIRFADSLYKSRDMAEFSEVLNIANPDLRGIEWDYLSQLTKGNVKFHDLPHEPIDKISFSPDGKFLLTHSSVSKQILKWDVSAGSSESLGEDIKIGPAVDFMFSPDNKWFVSYGPVERLTLWDTSASPWGKYVIPLESSDRFEFAFFSPDSKEIITAHNPSNLISLQHWDIQSKMRKGDPQSRTFGEDANILKVSATGKMIVKYGKWTETRDQIVLVDPTFKTTPIIVDDNKLRTQNYTFSPSGNKVAFLALTLSPPYKLISYVFDAAKGGLRQLPDEMAVSENLQERGVEMVFSANEEICAFSTANGVRVVNFETKAVVAELPIRIGRPNQANGQISFSPAGSSLAVSTFSALPLPRTEISILDVNSQENTFTFNDSKEVLSVDEDGTRVLTDEGQGSWTTWDTFNKKRLAEISNTIFKKRGKHSVRFSPDGEYLIATALEGEELDEPFLMQMWSASTGRQIELDPACTFASDPLFSPGGTEVAVFCGEGYIGIWDTRSGGILRKLGNAILASSPAPLTLLEDNHRIIKVTGAFNQPFYFDFETGVQLNSVETIKPDPRIPDQYFFHKRSPDLKWFVYGDLHEGKFFLRNESTNSITPLLAPEYRVVSINFSGNSKFLIVASGRPLAGNARNESYVKDLERMTNVALEGDPLGAELSANGKWAIKFGKDKIDYWNTTTGKMGSLTPCGYTPTFSADENRLLTSCLTGNVKFWDLASGQELLSIKTNQTDINKIVLSPDEKDMLTVSGSSVKLWRIKF